MVEKETNKEKKAPAKKGTPGKGAVKKLSGKKSAGARKTAKPARSAANRASTGAKGGKGVGTGEVARATLRNVRVSPRKARLVINLIKGKQVEPALQILQFSPKKTASFAIGLLKSAVANAVERSSADVDKLWVTAGWVDMGRSLKRYMPRAQGRATRILKRSCHITLVLGER